MMDAQLFFKELNKLGKKTIVVGFPKENDKVSSGEVLSPKQKAEIAEYGLSNGTRRPFVSISKPKVINLFVKKLTEHLTNNNFDNELFIEDFGKEAVKEVKKPIMQQTIEPKIKLQTILEKKSKGSLFADFTLMDTSDMVRNVSYVVRKK